MKGLSRILPLVLSSLVYLLTGFASAQTTVYKYHSDGTTGNMSFCNGSTCGFAEVSRNALGSNAGASMFLQASTFDTNQNVTLYYFGYGPIPATALQGDGTAELSLTLDFSATPLFTLVACAFDPATGSTCNNVYNGILSIKWHKTSFFTAHTTETTVQQYPGVQYQVSGTSDNSSASVVGSFLGTDFTTENARIGVQRSAPHSVQRIP